MNQVTQDTLMQDIDKRLSIVEIYIKNREKYESEDRKWIRGLVAAFIVQIIALVGGVTIGALEAGRLIQQLESIDVVQLRKASDTTAREISVLHGAVETTRAEQFRLRGAQDQLREELTMRTMERFYKSDGILLEQRISRLEEILLHRAAKDE